MKHDPTPNKTTISSELLDSLNTSLYYYLTTDPKALANNRCHTSRSHTAFDFPFNSASNASLYDSGPPLTIPENKSCCINIY